MFGVDPSLELPGKSFVSLLQQVNPVRRVPTTEQDTGENPLWSEKDAMLRGQSPLNRAVLPTAWKQRKLEQDRRSLAPAAGSCEDPVQRGCELIARRAVDHIVAADLDDHALISLRTYRQQRNLILKSGRGRLGGKREIGHRNGELSAEEFRPGRALSESTGGDRISDNKQSGGMEGRVALQVVGGFDRTDHQHGDNCCNTERVPQTSSRAETEECIRERCSQHENGQEQRKRCATQAGERNGKHRQESSATPHESTSIEQSTEVRGRGGQKERRC